MRNVCSSSSSSSSKPKRIQRTRTSTRTRIRILSSGHTAFGCFVSLLLTLCLLLVLLLDHHHNGKACADAIAPLGAAAAAPADNYNAHLNVEIDDGDGDDSDEDDSDDEDSDDDSDDEDETSVVDANEDNNSYDHSDDDSTCGYYLAQSSIPGAGLGLFAGRTYELWEEIGHPDICIPVVDYVLHLYPELDYEPILSFYGWGPTSFQNMDSGEGTESIAFCPGTGALPNCILPLANVMGEDDEIQMSYNELHRSRDPGSGAFTPYYNRQLVAKDIIEAGAELFDWYGEDYFTTRPQLYGRIPIHKDYHTADKFLDLFVSLLDSLKEHNKQLNATFFNDWYTLMATNLSSVWDSRVLNALPTDLSLVDYFVQEGTGRRDYNRSVKSIDWLQEHGYCMDHLRVGNSTLGKQVGRGAFATRFLASNSVIVASPLMHMNQTILAKHPIIPSEHHGDYSIDVDAPTNHYQLLLNYCFGLSPKSTVTLCPYGSLSGLINHSKEKANAKLEWNFHLMQHPEWLDLPPSEWLDVTSTGLVVSYIATRDIEIGEEIFIDYGEEWESAWNRHVATWQPPYPNSHLYRSALELNSEIEIIPTINENQYHNDDDVSLFCYEIFGKWAGCLDTAEEAEFMTSKTSYKDLIYCRALYRYPAVGGEDDDYVYTVELFERISNTKTRQTTDEVYGVLFDLPRDAFRYQDTPYSRDHYRTWSFRHEMMFPKDMIPKIWNDA